ncbi:MAG: sulfur carrier protein ThiS [Candidatus Edwardsbacteria bacterium]|nr:sulfur carrier protein ThiS [Candidatus Edwardsbacteria bacterium]
MNLVINGKNRDVAGIPSVADLLGILELSGARLVVEVNGCIVKKEDFGATALSEHDRIEIVRLVGGG